MNRSKNGYASRRLYKTDRSASVDLTPIGEANPFCTFGYVRAMQSLGREVWIITADGKESQTEVALGFLKRGKLSARLEFVSLPACAEQPGFWDEVGDLCKRAGVTDIIAGSYGSRPFELPPLPGEVSREARQEFVLQLQGVDLSSMLLPKHKQSIKKALRNNVTIRRTSQPQIGGLEEHIALMGRSAQRRLARGEFVTFNQRALAQKDADTVNNNLAEHRALIENGAAELFQAVQSGEVVSSALILVSPRTLYFQSAGNRLDQTSSGSSHLLLHRIAEIMQAEDRTEFNMGGASEGSSLARFKLRFGCRVVPLPSAVCYVGPAWKKKLRHAIERLRSYR